MELIERFKGFYRNFDQADLSLITELYTDEVLFRDPVHTVRGVADLHAYMIGLSGELQSCRFDYLEQVIEADRAFIKWDMHFSHQRLKGDTFSVRGMSHIQFNGKIFYHEDCFDMGALLYENLPVMGAVTRWLKGRLAHK